MAAALRKTGRDRFPGGVVTQYGVGAITVFVLLFLTWWIWFGGGEPAELPGATGTEATAPRSFTDRMAAQVEAEALRAETRRSAADRALRAHQQQQTNNAGVGAGRVTANEALLLAGPSPDTGLPYTEEEWELRERLRLEAVERRSRSLRSSPVAQTYRRLDASGRSAGERIVDNPIETLQAEGAEALKQALDTIETVTSGLEDEVAAEAQADQAFIEALRGPPTAPEAAPVVPAATAGSATARDYSSLVRIGEPEAPPGWERIYEGSFLEAALVSRNSPATSPARCWPWFPFLSIRRTGSASWYREGRGLLGTAQAVSRTRTNPGSP